MLISILKKIAATSLSLFIISLALFFLSKAVPGDPVEAGLGITPDSEVAINYDKEYDRKKAELGLHLPLFYIVLTPANFPHNLHSEGSISEIRAKRRRLMNEARSVFPILRWHGTQNQYHRWLFHAGTSLLDGKPVRFKIGRAILWTLFLVIVSLTLSYFIAIVLGVSLSTMKVTWLQKLIETMLFGIYAIPVFWLATVMLVFFTTKEYGEWTNIFPSVGLAPIDFGEAWYVRLGKFGNQLILPCIVLILHNLAFLTMLTKRNIDKNRQLAFVTTAHAYGFTARETLYRDVLPLSLLPLITSVSSAIPAAIGGSVVIEIIFNIPGMGRLLYVSILNYDWPIVFPIVLLIAVVTYLCFLLSDVFYKLADPRIK